MNVWGGGSVYVFRTTDDGATYGQVAKLTPLMPCGPTGSATPWPSTAPPSWSVTDTTTTRARPTSSARRAGSRGRRPRRAWPHRRRRRRRRRRRGPGLPRAERPGPRAARRAGPAADAEDIKLEAAFSDAADGRRPPNRRPAGRPRPEKINPPPPHAEPTNLAPKGARPSRPRRRSARGAHADIDKSHTAAARGRDVGSSLETLLWRLRRLDRARILVWPSAPRQW